MPETELPSFWNVFLTINYVTFALITQPLLHLQTVEAVRHSRFGPLTHDAPDVNSDDYVYDRIFVTKFDFLSKF